MHDPFISTDSMVVHRLVVGPLDNNCFVVQCRATSAAVIIDASAEAAALQDAVDGMSVTAILTTHGHADHVGAAQDLRSALAVPVLMHPADAFLTGWHPDEELWDGTSRDVGSLRIEVVHTPGHTPGSVCFEVDGHVFTGDTLFPGGPGATRFPYSDFDLIMESLDTRLFSRPDLTPFHPGHGASSTIGDERPEVEIWRQRRW